MARPTGFAISAIFCALCLLTVVPATADLIAPAITHVYFEKDGTPYDYPVDYSVSCYGYFMGYPYVEKPPGSYQPELIFTYSATCPGYGCEIYRPYYYRGHSDWCDLEGDANGHHFIIRNFSSLPYSRCDHIPYRWGKNWGQAEDYYLTPEYMACVQFRNDNSQTVWADQARFSSTIPVNSTSILLLAGREPLYAVFPSSHLIINKTEIPMDHDQYISYLETCDPATDPECSGWIVNGMPLKTFIEYRTLKNNRTYMERNPCATFLVRADPSLIMPFTDRDPWNHPCLDTCNYTEMICESRFTIPSEDTSAGPGQTGSPAMTRNETIVPLVPTPAPSTAVTVPPVLRSPVEALYCAIVQAFGGRCE